MRVGRLGGVIAILAGLIAGGCDKSSTGVRPPGPPSQMVTITGEDQEAVVGHELPDPLVVQVLDADGRPVPGQLISFVVTSGNGTLFVPAGITDAQGRAQTRWTLGTRVDEAQKVEARAIDAAGQKLVFREFTATPRPDVAAAMAKVGGEGQFAAAGERLAEPLTVKVVDQYGNPIAGATVAWGVTAGGGSLETPTATTNATGVATVHLTLGTAVGSNEVSATVSGIAPVSFTATGQPGATAALTIVDGNDQRAPAGTLLPAPLVVRITDARGNSVPGVVVSWAVTSGGGTLGPTTISDAEGKATAQLTLGTTAGTNTVSATVGALPAVTFSATASAVVQSLTKVSGDQQFGAFDEKLLRPLVVLARDRLGNPVEGAEITWTATAPGVVSPASLRTDANGLASVEWIPGKLGSVAATALSGTNGFATFTATGTSARASSAVIVSGNMQSGVVGARLAAPLIVRALDANGNGKAGVRVSFHPDGAKHGSTAPATVFTDASGYASSMWTLGAITGLQGVEATVEIGLPAPFRVKFSATAAPDVPATLAKLGGDQQSGAVGVTLPLPLQVAARDRFGNLIPNAEVTFAVTRGTGSVTPATVLTNAEGEASATFTLGTTSANVVTATAGTVTAAFTALPTSFIGVTVGGNGGTTAANKCALAFDGGVFCWGVNGSGELGVGTIDNLPHLRPVPVPGTFRSIDIGASSACALGMDNRAYCWGNTGRFGGPGAASGTVVTSPTLISPELTFSVLRTGTHTCGLTPAGKAYCAGDARGGRLGDGTSENVIRPFVPVRTELTFTDISVGDVATCGLTTDGAIYCWGLRQYGALGTTATPENCGRSTPQYCNTTPVPVESAERFRAMSVGAYGGCAIAVSGGTYCWGRNDVGQLGRPVTGTLSGDTSATPVLVSGGQDFVSISMSNDGPVHVCALTSAGEAYCWGSNSAGQLGFTNSTSQVNYSTPQPVNGGLRFSLIETGARATCGIADTAAYCWGVATGDGTAAWHYAPVLVNRR